MAFIPIYILILFFTILVDYVAGIIIEGATGRRRRLALIASIVANCGVLAIFKYYHFLNANLGWVTHLLHINAALPALSIILPIGLSFHTFQAMSYTIEVYRGRQKAMRHPGIYALYVMFYPQLVAGPIERPQNLIHQFLEKHTFDYARVVHGLRLMLWGLFKKMVIADGLGSYVDLVYGQPTRHHGFDFVIATVFFAFEIYCDFSGYSDIAIGAAGVLGFKLMTNFNSPYSSRSISEFWKRWHISLSTWFRDYLYIPLGGNRVSSSRWYFNILVTFLVSGLWHGANWTFVVWGGLNGFFLLASAWTQSVRDRAAEFLGVSRLPTLRRFTQTTITFTIVCITWVFFRAENIHQALYILTKMVTDPGTAHDLQLAISLRHLAGILICLVFMESVQFLWRHGDILSQLDAKPVWFRWAVYYGVAGAILLFGQFQHRQFIYFQF